jgi:hypothetical protein
MFRSAVRGTLIVAVTTAMVAGLAGVAAAEPVSTATAPQAISVTGTGALGSTDNAGDDPSADTTNGDDEMSVQSSRRFTINNLSGHRLKLTSIEGDKRFEGSPAVGSIIEPGGSQAVEVTYVYASTQRDDFWYSVQEDNGTVVGNFKAHLELKSNGISNPSRSTGAEVHDTTAGVSAGTYTKESDSITFLDPANTVHSVAATSAVGAKLLAQYCGDGAASSANCTFAPASMNASAWGDRHVVGTPVFNNTDTTGNWFEYNTTEETGVTNNIEVSSTVTVKLGKIVEASVTGTYGRSWTNTKTWGQTMHLETPAYTKNWVETANPVIRYTGDFVIKMGNTTWRITGASYDVPDPTRNPSYIMQKRAMTEDEKASMPPVMMLAAPEDSAAVN